MIEFVQGCDIAAEVKMFRTAFPGTILLVEGDTDVRFYERFTKETECVLLAARGKENVLAALLILEAENFQGAIGVVDRDFSRLISYDGVPENVCETDYHDIEIMIVESEAFSHVLKEYGSDKKVSEFQAATKNADIREALYETALPIGLLRLASVHRGMNLKFEGLKYDRIIDKKTLHIDVDLLIQSVHSMSNCKASPATIRSVFEEVSMGCSQADRRELCSGHDLVAVFCVGLRRLFGSRDPKVAEYRNIASVLRLAYNSQLLVNTQLYSCVKLWEGRNAPFRVFCV